MRASVCVCVCESGKLYSSTQNFSSNPVFTCAAVEEGILGLLETCVCMCVYVCVCECE